ncbi:MAG: carboxypeptidase-like regulatory domain-containing protein [Allomuricauda sp.]
MFCSVSKVKLIVLLSLSGIAHAQETKVKEIKGKVHSLNKDVVGVVVQNINSTKTVITDLNGSFSISVRLNDTLVFSAVQFKRKVLPIGSELFNSKFISVPLEEFVNQLDEVVVRPYNLSGDLNQDLDGLHLEKDVSAEALGLPNAEVRIISQSENKLHDADHGKFFYFYGLGFAINVNKILNRFSGRTKMLKKRVQLDKNYAIIKNVEEEYIDSLFTEHLKISKDHYYDFMYYCQLDSEFYDLVKQEDELRFWEFLLQKSKIYRENNTMD